MSTSTASFTVRPPLNACKRQQAHCISTPQVCTVKGMQHKHALTMHEGHRTSLVLGFRRHENVQPA